MKCHVITILCGSTHVRGVSRLTTLAGRMVDRSRQIRPERQTKAMCAPRSRPPDTSERGLSRQSCGDHRLVAGDDAADSAGPLIGGQEVLAAST